LWTGEEQIKRQGGELGMREEEERGLQREGLRPRGFSRIRGCEGEM